MNLNNKDFWDPNRGNDIGRVVDFEINSIPAHWTGEDVKRAAGVRHVVGTEVDQDNVKGTCTGTGRVQIRLSENETEEMI